MRVRSILLPVFLVGIILIVGTLLLSKGQAVYAARQLPSGQLSPNSGGNLHQGISNPARLDSTVLLNVTETYTVHLPFITQAEPPSCTPDPPGESDNISDALIVCSGQTVSGQVSDSDWDDVYKILAVANQQLTVSMNGTGGDADLYIYPPGTTDIYADPYVDSSDNPGNDEFTSGVVLTGGFWYIDVFSYEGTTDYNVKITLTGPTVNETKTFDLTGANQVHDRQQVK